MKVRLNDVTNSSTTFNAYSLILQRFYIPVKDRTLIPSLSERVDAVIGYLCALNICSSSRSLSVLVMLINPS